MREKHKQNSMMTKPKVDTSEVVKCHKNCTHHADTNGKNLHTKLKRKPNLKNLRSTTHGGRYSLVVVVGGNEEQEVTQQKTRTT